MSKIRLHGSSSGYTEIAPVAASGNNTLTLPNDGTIISKDSNGAVGVTSITVGTGVTIGDGRVTCTTLHGSAANCTQIPASNIVGVCTSGLTKTGGFGKLLQVVETVKTDTATQSSTIYAAISGLQPSITPTSSTSKILVMINLKIGVSHNYADFNLKLYRSVGGTETEIFSGDTAGSRTTGFFGQQDTMGDVGTYVHVPVSSQYLDSPSTTSAVTYLVKWHVKRSSTYIYCNRCGTDGDDSGNHRASSSITLMEIAP